MGVDRRDLIGEVERQGVVACDHPGAAVRGAVVVPGLPLGSNQSLVVGTDQQVVGAVALADER